MTTPSPQEADLRLRAMLGHAPSMYALGVAYLSGAFGKNREAEACRWLWLAREGGQPLPPWVEQVLRHLNLTLTPPPPAPMPENAEKTAVEDTAKPTPQELFDRVWAAANSGDAMGMTILGHYIEHGIGCPRDATTAYGWYTKAAKADNVYGLVELARCLKDGVGTAKDAARSLQLYLRAAYAGHDGAALTLGTALLAGKDLPHDPVLAFTLLRPLADKGDDTAYATLAFMYAQGIGTEADKPRAHDMITGLLKANKSFSIPDGVEVNTKTLCVEMGLYFEQVGDLPKASLWFQFVPDRAYSSVKVAELNSRMTPAQRQELQALMHSLRSAG
jgi:TPR repeat protein